VTLVRIVKNWDWPEIFRQVPGGGDTWEGVRFTHEPVDECDLLLILNRVPKPVSVRVPAENVWMLVQEPAIPTMDFVWEGHERFSRVLTHQPMADSPKYVRSQPAIPWHVNRTFDQLAADPPPQVKPKHMSVIASNLSYFDGHRRRSDFVRELRDRPDVELDAYGKGINFIEDKWDALAPYRHSIAIENSSSPDYWTEKLADCFLSWTVPLYFGCTNIAEYFPERSFIWLPLDRPEEALVRIMDLSTEGENDWRSRLDALKEARELVLHRYQFFPHLVRLIGEHAGRADEDGRPRRVRLPVREETFRYRLRRKRRYLEDRFRRWLGRRGIARL
jgi:hypothetical protein